MMRTDRNEEVNPRRRRFLTVLIGTLAFLPGLGATARWREPRRLSLREAGFYRSLDLEERRGRDEKGKR